MSPGSVQIHGYAVASALSENWGWVLAFGGLLALVAVVALARSFMAALVVAAVVLIVWFAFAGAVDLVAAIWFGGLTDFLQNTVNSLIDFVVWAFKD